MKNLFLSFVLLLSVQAQATDFGTQDNVNYNIVVQQDANMKKCAQQIRKIAKNQGNGYFVLLSEVGIITANLTSFAADQVSKLKCVVAIEVDGEVSANPRLGRSN